MLDEGDGKPGFIVLELPFMHHRSPYADKAKDPPERRLHPVLAVRMADGTVIVPDESLMWARDLIDKREPVNQIRRKLSSVGRLSEFVQAVAPDRVAQPGLMDEIVCSYLCARAEPPLEVSQRQFPHWQPVRYPTVVTEFRDLVDFARFCLDYTGTASVMGQAFKASSGIWSNASRATSPDAFFAHLDVQKARWDMLLGDGDRPSPPRMLKRLAVNAPAPKSANSTSLSIEQIDIMIDREKNFMFRALWILLAWCGPRISEALNMFYCDVVDPRFARKLFRSEFPDPAVPVFVDPKKSVFLGMHDARRSIETRTEYLKRFGLRPRPDHEGKNQRAGWKGMSVFNPDLLATHGSWTSHSRAAEFARLFAEIRQFHADEETPRRHPYLFVNAVDPEYKGQPLQMPNVRRAMARAYRRAGIVPHSEGASLHGLRHFYTWFARHELKIPESEVQRMLRHRSLTSNRAYGKRASDIHDAMEENMGTSR